MKLHFALFGLLTATKLFGSTVTASCLPSAYAGSPAQPGITNIGSISASCSVPSSVPFYNIASAGAQVVLSLTANPANWSALSVSESASAGTGVPSSGHEYGPGSEARTTVSYKDVLTTAGPLRAGYLQTNGDGSGNYVSGGPGGVGMTSGIIGTTELSCPASVIGNFCDPGPNYYAHVGLIPFLLGTSFAIEANGGSNAASLGGEEGGFGMLTTTYQFRFFEADGVTPVAVSESPEPSAWLLMTGGIGFLAFCKHRR